MTLAERGFSNIEAIDLDPNRIAELKKNFSERPEFGKKIKLSVGSLTSLPFPNETFDLIICSEVIEHIPEDAKAVSELGRVLKKGGTLLLSVPHDSAFQRKTYKRFLHERPGYTKDTLAKLLLPSGITIQKDMYYEYLLGTRIFNAFNFFKSKALLGILFYPFYILYLFDARLKIGEPNYIIIRALK